MRSLTSVLTPKCAAASLGFPTSHGSAEPATAGRRRKQRGLSPAYAVAVVALGWALGGCGGPLETLETASHVSAILNAECPLIAAGEVVHLVWSSRSADHVISSNFGATTTEGTLAVSPTETTTYTITVGRNGSTRSRATAQVTVVVRPAPGNSDGADTPEGP